MGDATPLMPVGRSDQRSNHPSGFCTSPVRQTAGDHWRTGEHGTRYVHYQTARYAVIGCKLQCYANEGCKIYASLTGLLLSFIVVVIGP